MTASGKKFASFLFSVILLTVLFGAACSGTQERGGVASDEGTAESEPQGYNLEGAAFRTLAGIVDARRSSDGCEPGCVSGDCENGGGTYVYPNCAAYAGGWTGGRRNGAGAHLYENGDRYAGGFKDDLRDTSGKSDALYGFTSGDRFTGAFQAGRPAGPGSYVFQDGRIFRGNFDQNGTGTGTLTMKDGGKRECTLRGSTLACKEPAQPETTKPAASETTTKTSEASSDKTSTIVPDRGYVLVLYAPEDAVVTRNGKQLSTVGGMALYPGDTVESRGTPVELQARDGVALRLRPYSILYIPPDANESRTLILRQGGVLADYDSEKGDPPFRIKAAGAEFDVDGTTFIVEIDADKGTAKLRVLEGRVKMRPDVEALEEARKEAAKNPDDPEARAALIAAEEAINGAEIQVGENEAAEFDEADQRRTKDLNDAVQNIRNAQETGADSGAAAASLTSAAEQLKKAPKAETQKFEPDPREVGERRLIISVDDSTFDRALAEQRGGKPASADTRNKVGQAYEEGLDRAAGDLEKELADPSIRTREDLLKRYEILEIVVFRNGDEKAGSIVAQAGDILILHALDGVFRVKREEIEHVDFLDVEGE